MAALAGSAAGTAVAVRTGDGGIVAREAEGSAQHSVRVLPLLEEALAAAGLVVADLGAVAFARGPGPFTAGRISTATAQGLGLALGVPLLPVSSLAALAHGTGAMRVATAIEAGQGEVYWGCYRRTESGGLSPAVAEAVATPEAVTIPGGEGWLGAGSGWAVHGEGLSARLGGRLAGTDAEARVTAASVAALGWAGWVAGDAVAPAEALPTYLRASYAQPPA